MAIVDCEEGAARPLFNLLELGLDDVEDDAHPIFVVIAHNALMGVGCIAAHYAILLACKLGWMV